MPIPAVYNSTLTDTRRKVDMISLQKDAIDWARTHNFKPAASDTLKICLLIIDGQIDFVNSDGNLPVTGRSGHGAIDDTNRTCVLIYELMDVITRICPTLDTHMLYQIFFSIAWVNDHGEHPSPGTILSEKDVKTGLWKLNPALCKEVNAPLMWLQKYCQYYTECLSATGKYALMIWPYHTMLGETGHAMNPSLYEAVFFHAVARGSQTGFQIKGGKVLTENYSVLRPEVTQSHDGVVVGELNVKFIENLLSHDEVWILGQAGSHCLAWTVQDLLDIIAAKDPFLAKKVSIVTDCTSAVVIPGVADFTGPMEEAFDRFRQGGMNLVTSKELIARFRK